MIAQTLDIANVRITFHMPKPTLEKLTDQWEGFFSGAQGMGHITVKHNPGTPNLDALHSPPTIVMNDFLEVQQADLFRLRFDLHSFEGELQYRTVPQDATENLGAAGIRGALVALWAALLPRMGGFLIHASGIRHLNKGILFAGPSGAGKSTLCGMFTKPSILNDELIAITHLQSQPHMHGTPFSGSLSDPRTNQSVPLTLAFALQQASSTVIEKLPTLDAIRTVAGCIALPLGSTSLERQVFELAMPLGLTTSWQKLCFARNPSHVRKTISDAIASL